MSLKIFADNTKILLVNLNFYFLKNIKGNFLNETRRKFFKFIILKIKISKNFLSRVSGFTTAKLNAGVWVLDITTTFSFALSEINVSLLVILQPLNKFRFS